MTGILEATGYNESTVPMPRMSKFDRAKNVDVHGDGYTMFSVFIPRNEAIFAQVQDENGVYKLPFKILINDAGEVVNQKTGRVIVDPPWGLYSWKR